MYVFVHHIIKNERVKVMIKDDQCVMDLVEYVGNYFKQISIDNIDENDLTLQYDGCILNESWLFKDINILPGSTLKCFPREINEPDFYVYIKILKETYQYFHNKTDLRHFSVFDLKVKLSEEYGFPLTIFRLRFDALEKDLLDNSIIIDYGIKRHSQLTLETWIGWDSFLVDCIKGYSRKVIRSMNGDEILKQYQIKVALYIAAHYGHLDLANRMLSMGAKAEQPVGDHPNRQWQVVTELKPEYMRCAIHEAVKSGQVKIVNLFINDKFWLLEHRDGYGLSTWRLSLHNSHTDPVRRLNQKDVAVYLLMKQRRARIQLTGNLHVSCAFYCNLKKWIDTAREVVFFLHGPTKSSYKKAPFNRGGLLGYKVLVDGYNHNFKEYQNAYDEMRAKYKHYYYLDDTEKQICDPLTYFRHLNAKLMVNSAATTFKPAYHSQNPRKSALKQFPTKRNFKWKKLINKIIMQNILKRYEHVLLKFGYDVVSKINRLNEKSKKLRINFSDCSISVHKEQGSIADQQMPHVDTHDTHTHNVVFNASKANQVPKRKILGLRTQLDAARPVANAKPLNKSFSAIETKRPSLLSVSRNMSRIKIGTSMSANEIMLSSREILSPDDNFILNENRKSISALASHSKLLDAKNYFHDGQNILFNSKHIDKNLVDSTIRPFSKCFADQTPKIIAKKYYVTAKEFKNKSWLKQLYISIRMASNDVQRRLQET